MRVRKDSCFCSRHIQLSSKTKLINELISEVDKLREENLKLIQDGYAFRTKMYKMFSRELMEEIDKRVELSPVQRSKIEIVFSIECARLAGVPEDEILKDPEEVEKFFANGES